MYVIRRIRTVFGLFSKMETEVRYASTRDFEAMTERLDDHRNPLRLFKNTWEAESYMKVSLRNKINKYGGVWDVIPVRDALKETHTTINLFKGGL